MRARILIIEEDARYAELLQSTLRDRGHDVLWIPRADEALHWVKRCDYDLVITHDSRIGPSGLDVLTCLRAMKPDLPILLAQHVRGAVLSRGVSQISAALVLGEGLDAETIHRRVEAMLGGRSMPQSLTRPPLMGGPRPSVQGPLLGKSQAMQALFRDIDRISSTSLPVLVRGAQGTGKKLTAETLYLRSTRTDRPLIVIHCAELPKSAAENVLFGSDIGERRVGVFEQAHGGSVLLEEVGQLPLPCQERLIRLLRSHCIQRLGSDIRIPADVRVLATTSQDLESAIGQGSFREDLFLRLSVVAIDMPTMEERVEDIPELITHFLDILRTELPAPNLSIQPEARIFLQNQRWPGNVSQLQQVLLQAYMNAKPQEVIALDHVLKASVLNQG